MKARSLAVRGFTGALLALTLVMPFAAAPVLAADDNQAVAINTEDGSSLFRFAFDIHRTVNDVIDETNIAISYASCESCQTVAIAIQIVLVASEANVVTPENVAIAINEECTTCETMAFASQFVIGVGGPLKIDSQGRRTIAEVRRAFLELGRRIEAGELTAAQIEQEVLPLIAQIQDVVDNHVVPAGTPDVESADGEDGESGESGEGEAPEAEGSPSGEPEATPSPSEDPAASPSAEPTETPDVPPSPTTTP